jgi:RNA polymerase sigma factor (TIGR02999 family)
MRSSEPAPLSIPSTRSSAVDAQAEHDRVAAPAPVEFDTLYRRLRAICQYRMEGERVDHTLQATALANEVFLRLFSLDAEKARNPAGATRWFVANAVIAIRQVLVDHARGVGRKKRGGGRKALSLGDGDAPAPGASIDPEVAERIRTVDTLLAELAAVSALQSEIVALRFFGGLSFAQIAAQVDVPETTVRREWALARIWMGKSRVAAGWGIDA